MKVGLLGGSFNPVHNGHIELAKAALDFFHLDKVLFLPSGNHPFKDHSDVPPIEMRYELTKKAISPYPSFEISHLDMESEAPSYTKLLVLRLNKMFPHDKFYFITGSDIIYELKKWYDYKWLLDNIEFIVAHRPGFDKLNTHELGYIDKFHFMKMKPIDISSTMIRKMIGEHKNITGLVPADIEKDLISIYSPYHSKFT
ncbi:MAG: nicotinate-nucleotide adenylyltransferase [Candidatus Celaenobacter antarcticus]|jgi:nicotinate-nucleotide adenylyltransferase|nr:nicotinate-nucleotide adenylyltransferase [Candidatus Tenebribacter davisii]MDP8315706.1 nicotinate-nucleotide adenylyltransferase [Candidatus Celaenobacter antarcticus]